MKEDDLIFLFHQGYTFCYFNASAGYDAPIYQYSEGDGEPRRIATGFAGLLEGELYSLEQINRDVRTQGGYFLSVSPEGAIHQQHPSLNSGIKALEIGDTFLD